MVPTIRSTLCPRPIAYHLVHICPRKRALHDVQRVSQPEPSKTCQPCVPVLVPTIMSTLCSHAIAYCVCARCHVHLVSQPYCLSSQCQPSCQTCVYVLVSVIISTLCPRLDARHHVNLVSPSWCPPSSQPYVPVLVPAMRSTLSPRLGARN